MAALEPFSVEFANGRCARALEAPPNADPAAVLEALGLAEPRPVVAVVGGANELEKRFEPRLALLFSRAVMKVALEHGAAIVDGGTDSGVMALMGQAVVARGRNTPLIGVAPAGKVTYPRQAPPNAAGDSVPLEPNHTHFVLVQRDEWGSEVDMVNALRQALSASAPCVTVLANGGAIAMEDVLRVVRSHGPIVVLAGSGRLADQIAQLARQRKPRRIANPRLAEILEEGSIDVFPPNGTNEDLVRTLERYLRPPDSDPALHSAWKQFAYLDANASGERRFFDHLQASILIFGVLATLLVLLQTQLAPVPIALPIADWLRPLIVLVTVLITVLVGISTRFKAGSRWVMLRGGAEAIKREIFRYRAGVGAYATSSGGVDSANSRSAVLAAQVNRITSQVFSTEITELALKPYRGSIPPPMYGSAADDAGYGPLSPAAYVAIRISDQINYYQGRASQLDSRLRRAQWGTLGLGGLATVLAALGAQLWVPLATALTAAIATYLEYQQVGPTLAKFNQAIVSLSSIQEWWTALPPAERTTQSNLEKLVGSTEQILEGELTGWVRQMRDALDKLYADQRENE